MPMLRPFTVVPSRPLKLLARLPKALPPIHPLSSRPKTQPHLKTTVRPYLMTKQGERERQRHEYEKTPKKATTANSSKKNTTKAAPPERTNPKSTCFSFLTSTKKNAKKRRQEKRRTNTYPKFLSSLPPALFYIFFLFFFFFLFIFIFIFFSFALCRPLRFDGFGGIFPSFFLLLLHAHTHTHTLSLSLSLVHAPSRALAPSRFTSRSAHTFTPKPPTLPAPLLPRFPLHLACVEAFYSANEPPQLFT